MSLNGDPEPDIGKQRFEKGQQRRSLDGISLLCRGRRERHNRAEASRHRNSQDSGRQNGNARHQYASAFPASHAGLVGWPCGSTVPKGGSSSVFNSKIATVTG